VYPVSVIEGPTRLVREARDLAQILLVGLPQRWRHTVRVAQRAEAVSITLGTSDEADTLVSAAWLHDIGYASSVHATGFHPLDGARYLRAHDWPLELAGLVAHHSGAAFIAAVRGLTGELSHFSDGPRPVADALAYADQTIGPDGRSMTLDQRFAEMLQRHGPDSPNAAAHPRRERRLREAVRRVDARLARLGRPSYAVARAWVTG
jgi:hypothetical protein